MVKVICDCCGGIVAEIPQKEYDEIMADTERTTESFTEDPAFDSLCSTCIQNLWQAKQN